MNKNSLVLPERTVALTSRTQRSWQPRPSPITPTAGANAGRSQMFNENEIHSLISREIGRSRRWHDDKADRLREQKRRRQSVERMIGDWKEQQPYYDEFNQTNKSEKKEEILRISDKMQQKVNSREFFESSGKTREDKSFLDGFAYNESFGDTKNRYEMQTHRERKMYLNENHDDDSFV